MSLNWATLSLVTIVNGDIDDRLNGLALLQLDQCFDGGLAFAGRILLNDRGDPAFFDALGGLRRQVPTEDLDVLLAALAFDGGDGADQLRFAGGVDRGHVGIGGHQVFGCAQRDILLVLAIDGIKEGDGLAAIGDSLLEPIKTLVLDEGIERADNAGLGGAGHIGLHIIGKELADVFASLGIVNADEGDVVTIRDLRVDSDNRDAGGFCRRDCGLHAVDIDGHENDAIDLLGDVVFDRVVLCGRHIVGVEDHQLGTGGIRSLLCTVIDLVEEQSLLVDGYKRKCICAGGGGTENQCHGGGCGAADQKCGKAHSGSPCFRKGP